MNPESIPAGATHYSDSYGIIYFYCVREYARSKETGMPFYSWHSWNGCTWQKESFVNDNRLKRL